MNNSGQIIKAKGQVPFAQIPNELLRNPKLSMKAKGLMSFLLSLPEDWVIYKTQLCDNFTDGRDGVLAAFEELRKSGYIVSVELIDSKGKFKGWSHIVYCQPIPADQISAKPIRKKVSPDSVFSEIGFAEIGKSVTTNKDSTKKEETKKEENIPHFPFSEFWRLYSQSNGEGKAQAQAQWNKMSEVNKMLATENVNWWLNCYTDKYEYATVPLAKTYLAGERWNDEFE